MVRTIHHLIGRKYCNLKQNKIIYLLKTKVRIKIYFEVFTKHLHDVIWTRDGHKNYSYVAMFKENSQQASVNQMSIIDIFFAINI